MKIIEAMKELRIIEKKMQRNIKSIGEYSSSLSIYSNIFGSAPKQQKEVKEYIQSSEDLLKMYLKLKQAIEKTNLEIVVEIEGKKYSISELLVLKRKLAKVMEETFGALSDQKAKVDLENMNVRMVDKEGKEPTVIRYYDEKYKNEGMKKWRDLYDTIDSKLEIVNATTDLVEKVEEGSN